MEKLIWHNEKRKVSDLKPFEGNPRQATEKEVKDLSMSIERFNLADPLVINIDNIVIGGNFRLRVLKEKGIKEIDVRVPNRVLTKKEAEELNIRLNKNQGLWDFDLLANFDEELLKDTGFTGEELDEIFNLKNGEEFNVEKEFEKAIKNPRGAKEGDIWQLGIHKLLIGDATKKESWERLLGKERFDFLFCDPPYRLKCDQRNGKKGFGYKGNRSYLGVEMKGKVPEYGEWLSSANEFQNPNGANVMIFENWRNTVELWQAIEEYWKIKNMIIWYAPNRHAGFPVVHSFFNKYDIALYGGKGIFNKKHEKEFLIYYSDQKSKFLDEIPIDIKRFSDHITWTVETEKTTGQKIVFGAKPVQILIPYIKILSSRDSIVIDCFGGSGSTLIASEIMKRQCRMIEMSPGYSEVILARWEKFTGKKAELISNGNRI